MVVRFTEPSARRSRMMGNLRAAYAATSRLQVAASESRRTRVQYLKSEPSPSLRWAFRRVSSARWAISSAVDSRVLRARSSRRWSSASSESLAAAASMFVFMSEW
jgi:hypothetical protein